MNPLDMMGPEFLRFYLLWGLGLLAAAWMVREHWRSQGSSSQMRSQVRWTPGIYPREGDAYTIALLRGDWREVVRTSLARLVSTGLLAVDGRVLRRGTPTEPVSLQPFETAVLAAVMGEEDGVNAVAAEPRAQRAAHLVQPLESELREQGLMPSLKQLHSFVLLRRVALFLVIGLGAAKLLVALSRGRFNVFFLVLMLIGHALAIYFLLRPPRRTRAGDRYVDWLKESHQGLRNLLASGRRNSPGEMALLTGIYGLQVVPMMAPLHTALMPRKRDGDGAGGDNGSSTSGCGSGGSGGDSGSSGCGGGGCGGGGCGGCGG